MGKRWRAWTFTDHEPPLCSCGHLPLQHTHDGCDVDECACLVGLDAFAPGLLPTELERAQHATDEALTNALRALDRADYHARKARHAGRWALFFLLVGGALLLLGRR